MDNQPSSTPPSPFESSAREQELSSAPRPSEQTRASNDDQTKLEERSFVLGYN
jgi:hypothetical protein